VTSALDNSDGDSPRSLLDSNDYGNQPKKKREKREKNKKLGTFAARSVPNPSPA